MGALFGMSIRQLAGRKRLALVLLLAAVPVGLTLLLNAFLGDRHDFEQGFIDTIIDGLIVSAIMPIIVMTLATAAFGNEIEDRTLNVLVLKPISRSAIVFPKLLTSVLVTGPVVAAAGAIVALVALDDGGVRAAVATAVGLIVGVLAYAAVFTWAGLVTARALGFALVYVFLWEGLLTSFLDGIRFLSVKGYTLGIIHGLDGDTFASIEGRVIGLPAAVVGAAFVTIGFTWLTVRRLETMDVQ